MFKVWLIYMEAVKIPCYNYVIVTTVALLLLPFRYTDAVLELASPTRSITYSLVPPHEKLFICTGALQWDAGSSENLLIGICSRFVYNISGGIGILNVKQLNSSATVLYGNVSRPHTDPYGPADYTDGRLTEAGIIRPHFLHQTRDGSKIRFVDHKSCAREVNRKTGEVTTVIGVGECGNGTLDWSRSISRFQSRLVYGFLYDELLEQWIFSILNFGLYIYKLNPATGKYESRFIFDRERFSYSGLSGDGRSMVLSTDRIMWQKVSQGVNMYHLKQIFANETHVDFQRNVTWFRWLSTHGGFINDPTAVYTYGRPFPFLGGRTDADVLLSPNEEKLMVVETYVDKAFFFDLKTGNYTAMCTRHTTSQDGNETDCTFIGVQSGMWIDDYTAIVVDEEAGQFKQFTFEGAPTSQATEKSPENTGVLPSFGIALIAGCVATAVVHLYC